MTTTETPRRRSIAPGATVLTFGPEAVTAEAVKVGKGFSATVNGLIIEGAPPLAAYEAPGRKLRVMEKGSQFAIGDFANALEERFGELAAQILDAESGWNLATLNVYRWVAGRIALADRRMDRLGIRHHLLVAALTANRQRHWLTLAADDEQERPWTVARLAKALKEGEDLPVSDFYVLVRCPNGQAQDELMARLEAEGLSVKAVMRRQRQGAVPAGGATPSLLPPPGDD